MHTALYLTLTDTRIILYKKLNVKDSFLNIINIRRNSSFRKRVNIRKYYGKPTHKRPRGKTTESQ